MRCCRVAVPRDASASPCQPDTATNQVEDCALQGSIPTSGVAHTRRCRQHRQGVSNAAVTEPGHKFPKSKRLLRHSDFQRVYQQGRRQFTGNMTVFFLRRSSEEMLVPASSPRVGFTVGKVLGNSVERSRIKRKMREAVRLSWPAETASVDVVFNPRKSVLQMEFSELAAEVQRGLKLAVQRAREAKAQEPGEAKGRK